MTIPHEVYRVSEGFEAEDWAEEAQIMLDSGKYEFARSFLESVVDQVNNEGFMTLKQANGIENIQQSVK